MKKIVTFGDIHLGLKTSDIDRTEEIVQVSLQAVNHAVKLKKKGFDVILVVGGDVFNHNDPSDFLISQFIRIINPGVEAEIKIYVLVGNHDSISKPKRKSCLQFLKKMKGSYSNVRVIDDIKCIEWFTGDLGPTYLTFLPHITKAHIEGTKFKSTQDYINYKVDKIWKKVGQGSHQVAFSHLNVRGLIPGSEENLLKKSEAWLPDAFIMESEEVGRIPPRIIQHHIHTKQKEKNINVIGAPLFCDFGEKEKKKFFCVVDVPETFGEKDRIIYKKTDCHPFIEINLDYTMNPEDWDEPKIPKNAILKINVTVGEEEGFKLNWEDLRKFYAKKCYYVKPIIPKIIRGRIKRNIKQTINLNPATASKLWLKKHKPKNWKKKLSLAKDYIGECL